MLRTDDDTLSLRQAAPSIYRVDSVVVRGAVGIVATDVLSGCEDRVVITTGSVRGSR